MNTSQKIRFLLVFLATCVVPASANNPPQPDGMLSLLLIFPVVLIGMRLADARPEPHTKWRPVLIGLLMALAFIISAAGDEIGAFGLLAFLIYGIVRGVQILKRGKPWKSWAIGTVVIAWVLFACVDYVVSVASSGPSRVAVNESQTVHRLRELSTAETEFAKRYPANSGSEPVYATMAELQKEGLLAFSLEDGQVRNGYRFGEIVEPSKRQILIYALPIPAPPSRYQWLWLLPGASLFHGFQSKGDNEGTGVRSFAVDETGVIHWAVRPVGTPVTWEPL
jgi:hypothetical protein